MLRLLLLTTIYPPKKYNMEDDLEAQLVQQLAEVRWLERREREVRLKAESKVKEKAMREARERAEREAQEREHWENKY